MRLYRGARRLYGEWDRNYRLRSGLTGLAAGLAGSLRLSASSRGGGNETQPGEPGHELDVVTFSVVPGLTRLWIRSLLRTLPDSGVRVLVGDCSGGLRSLANQDPRLRVIPLFNQAHGVKLDLFMTRLCRATTVAVCDDDIFWLSRRPLSWARHKLASRPELAVVSLYPRGAPKPILAGKVAQPMGSFCLVIRRDTWIREGLSFRSEDPSGTGSYDWTYDTADLAHQQLLERGHQVMIAPPEIRAELAALEGVSTWALKLQKHRGDMSGLLRTGLRLRKAYRVFRFLEELPALGPAGDPGTMDPSRMDADLVPPRMLARAMTWCRCQMPAEEIREIDSDVARLLSRIRRRSATTTSPAVGRGQEVACG